MEGFRRISFSVLAADKIRKGWIGPSGDFDDRSGAKVEYLASQIYIERRGKVSDLLLLFKYREVLYK